MIKKIKEYFSNLNKNSSYAKWLFKYTKPYIPSILLIMFCNFIGTITSVATAVLSKQVIDRATKGNPFLTVIIFYVIVMVVSNVITLLSTMFSTMVNEKFSFGIRKQIYEKILRSNWGDIQKYHTGDLMTRLTSDAGTIADGIANIIPSIISVVVEFFAVFFTLLHYDVVLALFAVIIAPVVGLASILFGRMVKKLQVKVQESEAAYRGFMQESLANILIVKTFCREEHSINRFEQLRNERFHWVFKKAKMTMVASAAMNVGFQLGYIVAFAWGAIKISLGTITYGTMSVFLTLVNRVQAPIYNLSSLLPKVVSILASAGRIIELQNISLEERNDETIEGKNISVDVKNLTFGYDKDELVLKNADTKINSGEFVAIVGESGVGKTTLIRLILSFIKPDEGEITFSNGENSEKSAASSREYISYVPQGNTLFSGTIKYNVSMGKLDATDEEIIDALKAAGAYEFVSKLPDGINTRVGEKGYGISEGQAQRVAIARALLKKAPFLVLDEATSSLDEATELKVLEGIKAFKPRPTCLLITHRRSVLNYCDREIKIQNKKIEDVKLG